MCFVFGLKVGHLLLMLCRWIYSIIPMNWFISGKIADTKADLLGEFANMWMVKLWGKNSKIQHQYYQYIGSERATQTWSKMLSAHPHA
uniref:Uncharacterized protein n=1 Tax=Kalanchoe fedtschenkoi TaxID=63787 RepID=A0A7N0TMH7_KALFE